MTDDGNNVDPKKERTKQESLVLMEFMRALQKRADELRVHIGASGKLDLSDQETRALNSVVGSGNMEAFIASVATFVFLRRFPKYLRQRAARRAEQRAGGYTLDPPGGKANSPFHNTNNNPQPTPVTGAQQQQQANPEGGLIWRSFQFTLDLTISTLVGVQVGAYMVDGEKIKRTISEMPLMEGRSGFSDHLCGAMVDEYKRQWKLDPNAPNNISFRINEDDTNGIKPKPKKTLPPFDRKQVLRDPQMISLQTLVGFSKNRMKRQALERRIRQERGLGPNDPVSIPSPGVNSSEWDSEGVSDDDGAFHSDSASSGDFYGGEKYLSGDDEEGGDWNKDDVSSFVSDQEDSKK